MNSGHSNPARLRELAAIFLKLGVIGFGGPAAHLGLMEQEFVRRRQWLTHEEFADLLAAANLIPGPNSTEMAIYIGQRRAGFAGLVVAGVCFIVPAMVIVTAIAWAYVRYGALPAVGGILYGVKPVIIAVVAQALWALGGKTLRTPMRWLLAISAVVLSLEGINELVLLLGGGLATLLARETKGNSRGRGWGVVVFPMRPEIKNSLLAAVTGTAAAPAAFGLGPLFLFFLKVGAVLYGSGYVLLAFLRSDLVEHWHWLTEAQLLDAVAVGQITPGPVFTTATFVGYVLGGMTGALVATVGIFLPAFCFVAISGPVMARLRQSARAAAFLDGVVAASLALMAVVTYYLARASLVDVPTVVLAIVSGCLLARFKINSAGLVLGGAVAGWILNLMK